jgi:hypothetical protein
MDDRERVEEALKGSYTPLINAIIAKNPDKVKELLNAGADPNEKDSTYLWLPTKWAAFVYKYGIDKTNGDTDYDDRENLGEIDKLLDKSGAENEPYNSLLREDDYNFSPIVTEDDYEEAQLISDVNNPEGGRRILKSKKTKKKRKTKKRKTKKSKTKKSKTKKRKTKKSKTKKRKTKKS